jgi:dihydrofolate reductase
MIVTFVVAMGENGVIGRLGQLPWRLPTDLKRFRKVTIGKPVVMGRKTYESIGKPLADRDNIVVTRQPGYAAPGTYIAPSVEAAVALGRELAAKRGVDEIAVIGGAEIFGAALPLAQRVYLTIVHASPEGDIVLDPFDPSMWREISREPMQRSAGDQFAADFLVLDRQA